MEQEQRYIIDQESIATRSMERSCAESASLGNSSLSLPTPNRTGTTAWTHAISTTSSSGRLIEFRE
jgi:hypothetical protein